MNDDTINASADTNLCEHCKQPVKEGDQALMYVTPNEFGNGNAIKMMVHVQCAPLFFGSNRKH